MSESIRSYSAQFKADLYTYAETFTNTSILFMLIHKPVTYEESYAWRRAASVTGAVFDVFREGHRTNMNTKWKVQINIDLNYWCIGECHSQQKVSSIADLKSYIMWSMRSILVHTLNYGIYTYDILTHNLNFTCHFLNNVSMGFLISPSSVLYLLFDQNSYLISFLQVVW